ncbi:glycosyltransferase family 2 protein [Acidithiobacillus sp. M4-SHS-6]|uniref:glycosyltransferase family 2 protein n=1 Tax=Acidithiobacillus sp. M4-SHS-6 TaxID=3383024 RepID=UPI0039BDB1A3
MNVSVVIINYNGTAYIAKCVDSCMVEGFKESEIIVVDNGSIDDSVARVHDLYPDLQVVANSCNAGFARAVNQGIRASSQDYVLILNNDARLLPGAIEALEKCASANPDAALIGARLVDQNLRPQNVVAPFPNVWRDLLPRFLQKCFLPRGQIGRMADVQEPMSVPTLIGAALMLRRSALPQLGLMDEDFFFYLEETEWCHRAHALGLDVVFCPQAMVMHELGGTANRYRAAARVEFHRSRLLYARKVEGKLPWAILSLSLYVSSTLNMLSNACATVCTLFLIPGLRRKTRMYATLCLWHCLGRPRSWGLPNKCPQAADG